MTAIAAPLPRLRVSDAEREQTVAILRDAWLAGRLDEPDFEARCSEAWAARYVDDLWGAVRELPVPAPSAPTPRPQANESGAGAGLALSITGLCIAALTFGLAFPISLPFSIAGWAIGRGVESGAGKAARVLGLIGTIIALLALTGCAVVIARAGH